MPVVVAEREDEGVVVGFVIAIAHEKIKHLKIVVRWQSKHKLPINIQVQEEARHIVIDKIGRVAGGNTSRRGNIGVSRTATDSETGQLIFEPSLIRYCGRNHPSSKLCRHSIIRLGKDLTRGLVFEHVRRGTEVDTARQLPAKAPYIAELQNHLAGQAALYGEINHMRAAVLK